MEGHFLRNSPQRASHNLVIGHSSPGQNGQCGDKMRQRAMQAVEYYQKMQRNPDNFKRYSDATTASAEGYLSDGSSAPSREGAVDNYYRVKLKGHGQSGEARNSYAERKQVPLANTHWKTVMSPPSAVGGVPYSRSNTQQQPEPKILASSVPVHSSVPPPSRHKYPKWHKKSPEKGNLYRSNSSLDIDQVDEAPPVVTPSNKQKNKPGKPVLRRDYGSTSSLDLLGQSNPEKDSFFSMLKNYRNDNLDQRSPAPAKIQQLLGGKIDLTKSTENNSVNFANVKQNNVAAVVEQDSTDGMTSPKTKAKFTKGKEKSRKDSGPALFRKLRGAKSDGTETTGKVPDNSDELDERLRRKAFVHYDCQSIGLNLLDQIKNRNLLNKRRNTATGASAASVSYSFGGQDADADSIDDDNGDGKSNDLVLSCPFFRNELGGEEERTISLTRMSAARRMQQLLGNTTVCDPAARSSLCNGVSTLDTSTSADGFSEVPLIIHKGYVIEYVDQGAYYYRNYFLPYEHQNYFGNDENLGPVAISIYRGKVEDGDKAANKPGENLTFQYRIIIRTSELSTIRGSVLEEVIPYSSRFSSNRGLPFKDILDYVAPEINLASLRLAISGPKTCEELMKLDEQGISKTYKVGIMYCKAGQCTEEEMYNNEQCGPAFDEFLRCIAEEVRLKHFDGYRAGLDNKTDSTGTHSMYAEFKDYEIMFHVSTMLPYTPNNKQQLLRKCHIGNDIVTIVFQEPGALPFTPKTVRSHFQHVFIIIQAHNPNTDNVRYSVAVSRSKDVPPFGPAIPDGAMLPKSLEFADFLLAKVINAENAVHRSQKFVAMAVRTRQEYLKGLAANYTTNITPEAGSKLGKFGLGSGRKRDKTKQRVIPDLAVAGAIVWAVQVEDFGQSVQVDCLLGISTEMVVVIEEETRDVVFAVHCRSVIGWTSQTNSLRLYYNHGECIVLKTTRSEGDEVQEIVSRLLAVSQGCETMDMTLRRNGLGQLGFHVQTDGVISDVEPYDIAWEKGLRIGSRLVEICKVATATLTHDQMIDLLRTSVTVKVVVVPPMEDGTVRKGYDITTRHSIATSGDFLGLHNLLSQKLAPRMASSYADINAVPSALDSKVSQSGSSNPSSRQSQHKDYVDINNLYDQSNNSSSRQSQYKDYIDINALSETPKSRSKTEENLGHTHSGENSQSNSRESLETTSAKQVWFPRPYQNTREQRDAKSYQDGGGGHSERWYEGSDRSDHSGTDTSRYSDPNQAGSGVYLTRSVGASQQQSAFSPVTKKPNHTPQDSLDSDMSGPGTYHKHSTKHAKPQDQSTSSSNLSQISDMSSHSHSSGSSHGKLDGSSHHHLHHHQHGFIGNKLHTGHDRQREIQKEERKPQFLSPNAKAGRRLRDISPSSSANSSPRASNKNLSAAPLDDAAIRLRPGVSAHSSIKPTEALKERSFQEELMRLIDPDVSEADIRGHREHKEYKHSSRPTSMVSPTDFKQFPRLQRTLSDESICGANTPRSSQRSYMSAAVSDVIFTPNRPVPPVPQRSVGLSKEQRLSPRAITGGTPMKNLRSAPPARQEPSPIMPLPDNPSDITWSHLVDAATRGPHVEPGQIDESTSARPLDGQGAMESDRSPSKPKPSQEQSMQDKLSVSVRNHPLSAPTPWRPQVVPSSQKQDLESKYHDLQEELGRERKEKQELIAEVEQLKKDNLRLQEESQTAAAQLRKFTEWFFNTIDRQ
ncbi:signal-induced proliferation-associated 1-like protein 1 [Lineus longissimus]|uniref:signal-induced proliferation-associated 1-like protein 1 n=1 Tax=Lineus longissimus TaxID=88925 RepID=UPI002B4F2A82